LKEDQFVYVNFNQNYKIDPDVFKIWMKILKRVPNAVLWLLKFPPLAEANLWKEAKKQGIRQEDGRIVFSDVAPREEHIQRGYLADLFLDTPLCNAHTTAVDILWSGTPLLTLSGDKMSSRVAASLLHATGLGDQLIAKNYEGNIL
jgi:protein O-GlcNAc transferase